MVRAPLPALLLLAACAQEPSARPDDPTEPDPCGEQAVDSDGDGLCDALDPCPLDPEDDSDGDGLCDSDDPCPDDPNNDSDADGVCDSDDLCPGHDDALDSDADGVPDGCDTCEGHDDTADQDADGVPDGCDICPDGDDTIDTDADGVPDACDACPEDPTDHADTDEDGVCDLWDLCDGHDDAADEDGDGVPDGCDICPGHDDAVDSDADGTPDGCDACPDDPADDTDSDADGICDVHDLCPGHDDALDTDADGVPDGCDACEGHDDSLDADADGVPDACDACEGHDDAVDADGDGIPDACDTCPDDHPDDPDNDGFCGCTYPNVPIIPQPQPAGGFTPVYVGLEIVGIVEGSAMEDYELDGVLKSARAEFTFYDANFAPQCQVIYDLSEPGVLRNPTLGWHTVVPVTLYETWDFYPSNGWTDCPDLIHPSWNGMTDILFVVEVPSPYGLGLGPMFTLDADMMADPVIGPDWSTDYAPYAYSLWIHHPFTNQQIEVSYAFSYENTCRVVELDGSNEPIKRPAPVSGPLSGAVEARTFHLVPFM